MKFNTTLGMQTELKHTVIEHAPVTIKMMEKDELEKYLKDLEIKNKYKNRGLR